jgi:hypothetical protein
MRWSLEFEVYEQIANFYETTPTAAHNLVNKV